MKVSILIPLHNSEKYIAQTIQCALNQTWSNKEIIIVNDGSSDQSLRISKSFESGIVKIHSQENKGAAAARNIAFRLSTGDYIQYLDADDLLSSDKIEKQMGIASVYSYEPHALFTCQTKLFTNEISLSEVKEQPTDRSYETPIEILTDLFTFNSFIPLHAYLTPRHLIDRSSGWNEELSANDDGDFFARVIKNSKKIIFTSDCFAFYRNTHNSLSKQKSFKYVDSEYQSLKNIAGIILEHQSSEENRIACSKIFNWFIYDWFPENKPVLKEVEKTMRQLGLTFFSSSDSKVFHLIKKYAGWRRAILFSEIVSEIKNKN